MYANPNYPHVPVVDDCRICGFMNPDFKDYDDLYSNYCPREFGSTAVGGGRSYLDKLYPIWRRDEHYRYQNHSRFSRYDNIEAVSPDWLREELKRLFPETRKAPVHLSPPVLLNDQSSASCSPSDLPGLLDLKNFSPTVPPNDSDSSWHQHLIRQTKPHVLATFTSLQLQTASIMVRNKSCAPAQYIHLLPTKNSPASVQPYTNTGVPKEALSSNIEKLSSNKTTSSASSSEEISNTNLVTKEISNTKTSVTADSQISSTSNTSTANVEDEWMQKKSSSNRRQKEKQSSTDSSSSGSSWNSGIAHGARSKAFGVEKVTASGTTVSDAEGGGQWCSFCAKNGETEAMVTSHKLYKSETNLVQCPILRAYRCETCNATGDFAHTRSYCPRIRMLEGKVRSATIALKSTQRQANGMVRNAKVIKSTSKLTIAKS